MDENNKIDELIDLLPNVRTRKNVSYSEILFKCNEVLEDIEQNPIKYDEDSKKLVSYNKAICLTKLKNYDDAVSLFISLGFDEHWARNKGDNELFNHMVKNNPIFLSIMKMYDHKINSVKGVKKTSIKKEKEQCEKIYNTVLEILELLKVEEGIISHYTSKKVAKSLIFKESCFRLSSIISTNDSSEGKVLYDFFSLPESNMFQYQSFISCFTFHSDNLNQFRLYGKENDKEGTGISLSFNCGDFFVSQRTQLKFESNISNLKKIYSLPLYRCIYVDPVAKEIISLGHSDRYVILCESDQHENSEEKIIKNETDYHMKEGIVRVKMKLLNDLITEFTKKEDGEKKEIVCKLLINMRFLIKHAAFKEEQECRIFSIQKIKKNDLVNFCPDTRKMYIEYPIDVSSSLQKVTFAPKTTEFELFSDRLEQLYNANSENIKCIKSRLPLA